jgi:hypothetical protein
MPAIGLLSGGLAGHSTYRQDATFSSTHFSIVLVLVLELYGQAAFRVHRFLSRGSPQSLEGSRFVTYRFQRHYLSQTANPRPENLINKRLPGTAARVAFTHGVRLVYLRRGSPWGKSRAESFPGAGCCNLIELRRNKAGSPPDSSRDFPTPDCPNPSLFIRRHDKRTPP